MTNERAIIHIDMDAFFASVAQQQEAQYKGKPVITGSERAIATSISYEAKALGIRRCMPIHEIRKICPQAILLPSDYETIGLFSKRIFQIIRKYTSDVEEYSVDECFADLTGMDRPLKMTYQEIALAIQRDIDEMLGATSSIGLAPTKTLAKIASKWKKPHGFTHLRPDAISEFLAQVPVGDVWGIGPAHTRLLHKEGIRTALEFAQMPYGWIRDHLNKPEEELWWELNGKSMKTIKWEDHTDPKSIQRHKTFWPATSDPIEVFSRLCKNIENACTQLRKYGMVAERGVLGLRRADFSYRIRDIEVPHPTAEPQAFIAASEAEFMKAYRSDKKYRATFFAIYGLEHPGSQASLFPEDRIIQAKRSDVYQAIDAVNGKYGRHVVHLGASFKAMRSREDAGPKSSMPWRKRPENWLPGETEKKKVNIPYCGWVR